MDEQIAELEQENRLLRARNERLQNEIKSHAFELEALAVIERARVVREALHALERSGQSAAVSVLRHHFKGVTNG